MKRRYYSGRDFRRAQSIAELREMARRWLPGFAFEFLESGGEDEVSLAWNRDIFQTWRFEPRMLVDTSGRHIRTRLFGRDAPSPLILAPTGHNNIIRRDGDLSLARAAAAEGIPYTLSTLSNTRLERLPKEAGGRLWMQLYVFADRALTDDIVRRADESGYDALVLTVDSSVFGLREWDRRHFRAPGTLAWRSLVDVPLHLRWYLDAIARTGVPGLPNVIDFFPPDARDTRGAITHIPKLFMPTVTWETVAELRKRWPRKFLLKGILSLDDARRAADAGCDGIVLSNHGGRHLDACLSPMEVLPEVAAELGSRMTIVIDSGFRRGGDVVKALALGAHAVMVGRAPLYGLAAGGEAGVRHTIQLLNSEIDRVLGQIGCCSLADLGPHFLRRSPALPRPHPLADMY